MGAATGEGGVGHAAGAVVRDRRLLAAVLVGLVLRLVWVLLCPNEAVADPKIYHEGAAQIAAGAGYAFADGEPNGIWPPGYSALVAVAYRLFGTELFVGYVLNVLLGCVLVVAVALLTDLLFGRAAAVVAAWITALYPTFVLYVTILAAENLYDPLLVLVVYLAVRMFRVAGPSAALLAGLALGATILVRSTAFALPGVMLLAGVLARAGLRRTLTRTAIATSVALLVCIPWGLRNSRVFGVFSFTSFNSGTVLWIGNHEGVDPTKKVRPERYMDLSLPERNERYKEEAVEFIRANPGTFARLSWNRAVTSLRAETIGAVWNTRGIVARFGAGAIDVFKVVGSLGYYALSAACLFALAVKLRRKTLTAADGLLVAVIGVTALPFFVFHSQDRYHLPMIPFVTAIAASVLAAVPRLERLLRLVPRA